MHPVIAVYERNPLTIAVGKYPVQSCISCSRQTTILLMNYLYTTILPCILIADSRAAVGRAVVYQNDLNISKCLG
ncbi:hypothetical protein BACCAP_01601 [Pseudoflavonifractor capillosus ATCC 29799]|uniref:Uncharacterized protein n=1 Tax=Pseudoflavonifractor capillosus ATCC 29799 TaxID=411467 RepID=A6NTS2_9FIRM|nr:hypothetical protein BACCAP_01601 [Pseudoflavonifractor capillosus ATCC 29799]